MRPGWLILAVVSCVAFGAALDKCLSCAPTAHEVNVNVNLQGKPFLAATATPDTTPGPAPAPAPGAKDEPAVEKNEPRKLTPLPVKKTTDVTERKKVNGKWLEITFEDIAAYEYKFPEIGDEAKPTDQIPASIKKLGGKEIAIQGFMIPIKTEGEEVLEFVLVRNQFACCYGVVPKMNEWLHVKMKPGKTAPYALDVPITIYGTLEVGELWENGVVMSLYRLECVDVTEPPLFK